MQDLIDAQRSELDALASQLQTIRKTLAATDDLATENAEAVALLQRPSPFLLGPSAVTRSGGFEFGGDYGVSAANAACDSAYPGEEARMCFPEDVRLALYRGDYDATAKVEGEFWTIAEGMESDSVNHLSGSLGGSCQELRDASPVVAVGTTMVLDLDSSSVGKGTGNGPLVWVAGGELCNSQHAVLCCR